MSKSADIARSARQRFAAPGSAHDRRIAIMRVVFPAAVGALAALLALSPFSMRNELSFVLDKNKVAVARERMRLTEALYRGEDSQGRPFSLKAGSAVQKSSAEPVVRMQDLSARILLSDGPAQILASSGRYNMDRENVLVDGPVQVNSAGGYRLSTSNVLIDLKTRALASQSRVSGSTNIGTFAADHVRADLGARTVTLDGNAKLRIVQNGLKGR
ncbi:MAG: LPS export ABC transporter periplasmic protein LptC [Parasphingorhabdus sp.]|nr:LPS export ABC transporter periplasmic protein LptC [Parasphingorhabdus sp.]